MVSHKSSRKGRRRSRNTRWNKYPSGRGERPHTGAVRITSGLNGASSFSVKANVPSGNAPAFGSFAAASNPPTLDVTSSPTIPHPGGFGDSSAPSADSISFKTSGTSSGFGTSGLSGFGGSAAAASLTVPETPNASTGTSPSSSSSPWIAQAVAASGQNTTSAPSAVSSCIIPNRLYTPRSELTAEELQQFEAKRFTVGKVPLKPPPADLLFLPDSIFF